MECLFFFTVVGVSSDSTVCVWDRRNGQLKEVFYHHRASVWGVRIQNGYIITGSMDGFIAVIDAKTLQIKKHFLAHENEWGSEYWNSLFCLVLFPTVNPIRTMCKKTKSNE